ncbi:MAG: DUF5654 family protein [Patescibacteria group bacterium]|nr:DUF5654 family protein [Patescibacteria group bacterium]
MWNQTAALILTAFGLVAGLAWNSAVSALIAYFFPVSASGLIAILLRRHSDRPFDFLGLRLKKKKPIVENKTKKTHQ